MEEKEIEKRLKKLEEEVQRLKQGRRVKENNQLLSQAIGLTANLIGLVRSFPLSPNRDQAVATSRRILKILRQIKGEKKPKPRKKEESPKPKVGKEKKLSIKKKVSKEKPRRKGQEEKEA